MVRQHSPTRQAAALGAAALVFFAASSLTARADDTWRDGWCREGEGLTVVVDWFNATDPVPEEPGNQDDPSVLVRCIPLPAEGKKLPTRGADKYQSALLSAGISFTTDGKLITGINGIEANPNGEPMTYWHSGDGTIDGWGKDSAVSGVLIDQFWAWTHTDPESPGGKPMPRTAPEFDPEPFERPDTEEPDDTEDPDETESPGGEDGDPSRPGTNPPKESSKGPKSPKPSAKTSKTAKPTPKKSKTPKPTPSRSVRPTPTRTPSPQRTSTPTPTPTPSVSPSPTATAMPSPTASASAVPQAVAPSPTPTIWGEENAAREPSDYTATESALPWSPMFTVAGMAAAVGALLTAAVAGLRTPKPVVVEDE